jgi:hypothetical protein
VLARCLQKDRTARFANIADLAVALVPFGPPRGRVSAERAARMIEASGQVLAARPPPAFPDAPPARTMPDHPGPQDGGWVGAVKALPSAAKAVIGAGMLVAAVAGASIAAVATSGDDESPAAQPSSGGRTTPTAAPTATSKKPK